MKILRTAILIAGVLGLVLGCGSPLTHVGPLGPAASDPRDLTYEIPEEPGAIGGPGAPLVVPLIAGRTIDVGTVEVWLQEECLHVRYTTDAPWCLAETHMHVVADDPALFPQTKTGNPKPGQFAYGMTHAPGTASYTYCLPIAGLEEAEVLYFAAHAEVEQWVAGACLGAESAWAAGLGFPGANWATYFAGVLAAAELDLTGYWDMYLHVDGMPGEMGPGVFYIHQEGSELDCSLGMSGTLEGSLITLGMWFPGEEGQDPVFMGGEGTASEEEIFVPFTGGPFGSGWIRYVPTTITFGHLDIDEGSTCQGIDVEWHTDCAFAETGPTSDEFGERTEFAVTYVDHQLQVNLWFNFEGPPPDLPIQDPLTITGGLCFRWLVDEEGAPGFDGLMSDASSITLTAYDEQGMVGTFWAQFGGETITGSFDVPFVYGYGIEPPEGGEEEP